MKCALTIFAILFFAFPGQISAQEKPLLLLRNCKKADKIRPVYANERVLIQTFFADSVYESKGTRTYGKIVAVNDSAVIVAAKWQETELLFVTEESSNTRREFPDSVPDGRNLMSIPLAEINTFKIGRNLSAYQPGLAVTAVLLIPQFTKSTPGNLILYNKQIVTLVLGGAIFTAISTLYIVDKMKTRKIMRPDDLYGGRFHWEIVPLLLKMQ